jgi:hypothetical protein
MKTRSLKLYIVSALFVLLTNLNGNAQVVYSQHFDGAWSTSVTSLGWTGTSTSQGAWHRDDNFTGWSNAGGPGNQTGGHSAMCDNYDQASV